MRPSPFANIVLIKLTLRSVDTNDSSQSRTGQSNITRQCQCADFLPFRNVPGLAGPQHDVYLGPPPYYASQGEASFPTPGFGHGVAHLQEPGPFGPQPGLGHGVLLQQPPFPVGQSPHFSPNLPHPAHPVNIPYPSHPYNFPAQPILEPMIATSSHPQGPAVQNAGRGPYYGQAFLIYLFL